MTPLTRNILYNLAGQAGVLLLGLLAVTRIYSRLGPDALGLIYFAFTLNSVLCAGLDLGISATAVREIAARIRDDRPYVLRVVQTASLVFWAAFAVAALLLYWAVPLLVTGWIRLTAIDAAQAVWTLRVLSISALLGLPRALYVSVCRGLERMEWNNLIDVLTAAFQQAGTLVLLGLGLGLRAVSLWLGGCFLLGLLAYLVICARLLSWRALAPRRHGDVLRRNLRYASHMSLIALLTTIHLQMDKLVASKLLPIGAFGFYAIAAGAVLKAGALSGAISQAALPAFSALWKNGGRTAVSGRYRKLQDLLCFGSVPVYAGVVFAALPVFGKLFSPEVALTLLGPVCFLCLGHYMAGTLAIPYVVSLAGGKPEIYARTSLLSLLLSVPAGALLISRFGLAGAGLSWVATQAFAYGYMAPRLCRECVGIPPAAWYRHVARVLLLAAGAYAPAWLLARSAGAPILLCAFAAASVLYLAGAWRLADAGLRRAMPACVRVLLGDRPGAGAVGGPVSPEVAQ